MKLVLTILCLWISFYLVLHNDLKLSSKKSYGRSLLFAIIAGIIPYIIKDTYLEGIDQNDSSNNQGVGSKSPLLDNSSCKTAYDNYNKSANELEMALTGSKMFDQKFSNWLGSNSNNITLTKSLIYNANNVATNCNNQYPMVLSRYIKY